MARPWGGASKPWADEVDAAADAAPAVSPLPAASTLPAEAFPSLGEAAATKPSKKKKGQAVTLSLGELQSGKYVPAAKRAGGGGGGGIFSDDSRLTSEEMMALPTGPKERTEQELNELSSGRLGGGFRDFRGDRDRGGDREREQRGFGFDRERETSRADDSSDWGANKSSTARVGGRYDDERRGGRYDDERRGSDRDLPSKADEVDSWTSGKKFVPSETGGRRYGGYEDARGGISKADAEENWSSRKFAPSVATRDRDRGDTEKWSFKRSEEDANGADGDKWSRRGFVERSERPRLNLQPRTLPVEHPLPLPVAAKVDTTTTTTSKWSDAEVAAQESTTDKEGELLAKQVEQKAKVWDGTSPWRKSMDDEGKRSAAAAVAAAPAAAPAPAPNTNAWKKADNVVVVKEAPRLDRW